MPRGEKALPAPSGTRGWGGKKSVPGSPSPGAGWMGRPPLQREKRLALTFCCLLDVLLQYLNLENLNRDPP